MPVVTVKILCILQYWVPGRCRCKILPMHYGKSWHLKPTHAYNDFAKKKSSVKMLSDWTYCDLLYHVYDWTNCVMRLMILQEEKHPSVRMLSDWTNYVVHNKEFCKGEKHPAIRTLNDWTNVVYTMILQGGKNLSVRTLNDRTNYVVHTMILQR